jgi:hypothetical protein
MNNDHKLDDLNGAMTSFIGQLNNNTVIGAVQFAGLASFPNSNSNYAGTATLINYKHWGPNKTDITNKLTGLHTYTNSQNDGTYIRNAFHRAIDNLNGVKDIYRNQGYTFVTIIFTDGVPETQYASDSPCEFEYNNPYLCFAKNQDPRFDLTNTATGMRGLVDKVYSVGVYSGQRELQALSKAQQLLKDIASKSSYATDTSDPSKLSDMFNTIINSVCQ